MSLDANMTYINSLIDKSNILVKLENYLKYNNEKKLDNEDTTITIKNNDTDYYYYLKNDGIHNEVSWSVSVDDNEHPNFEIGYGDFSNTIEQVILSSNGFLTDNRTHPTKKYQITRPFKKVTLYLDENNKMVIVLGTDDDNINDNEFKIATNVTIDRLASPFIKFPPGKSYTLKPAFTDTTYPNLTGYIAGSNGLNADTPCITGCFIDPTHDARKYTCVTPAHGMRGSTWDRCDIRQQNVEARKTVINKWNTRNSSKKVAI